MPLIADALTDAQDSANKARHKAVLLHPHASGAHRTAYDEALIRAYLSHPAVRRKVYAVYATNGEYPPASAGDELLEAIGGDTP